MCGFIGIVNNRSISDEQISKLELASESIKFRGPDYVGKWINQDKNIAIIHNRLSILDISESGHQPMQSINKRYTLAYNGELYNYLEIKNKINHEFSNVVWKGTSDTEVFLRSIEYYGLMQSLKLFNGMFSFSLWDNDENLLYLGRDLIGEKPLYYCLQENNFYFSSQIKCFKKLGVNLNIDNDALKLYLNLNYIPAPYSIFKNVKKLQSGSILKYDFKNNNIEFRNFKNDSSNNKNKFINKNPLDLDKILQDVVSQQLVADVPVGVFLSGGIDSSLIASVASKVSEKKIKTFCISQSDKNFDESKNAKVIGKYLNTDHHDIPIDKSNILEATNIISDIYDEPFADSSQIPTTILCKEVSKYGKVFLTGDGGDEVFGGYNRYIFINFFNNVIYKLHPLIRKSIKKLLITLSSINSNLLDKLLFNFFQNFNNKLFKISHVIDLDSSKEMYKNLIINFYSKNFLSQNIDIERNCLDQSIFQNNNITDIEKFMTQDICMYLPDDIFVKTDRASMYYSIETRSPLVDRRIVNFSKNLKNSEKIKGLKSKVFIRKVLENYLPKDLINKKKMGFGLPLGTFIRKDLKDFSNDSINYLKKKNIEFINFKEVDNMMSLHQNYKYNYEHELWSLIMLSQWYRKFSSD